MPWGDTAVTSKCGRGWVIWSPLDLPRAGCGSARSPNHFAMRVRATRLLVGCQGRPFGGCWRWQGLPVGCVGGVGRVPGRRRAPPPPRRPSVGTHTYRAPSNRPWGPLQASPLEGRLAGRKDLKQPGHVFGAMIRWVKVPPPPLSSPPPLVVVRSPCQEYDPADAHPQRAQVSAGVGKPPHGLGVCVWMHLVNGTGNSLSPGRPTPGVVKQDKSSAGSVDTSNTRLGPQRVRMSSGERPIGAAKGKQ